MDRADDWTRRLMKAGDLVRRTGERQELGIVFEGPSGLRKQLVVFLGDGSRAGGREAEWEPVPFCSGGDVTANFKELVDAYKMKEVVFEMGGRGPAGTGKRLGRWMPR